jgi:ribose transport system substrate-binding protein
LLAAAVFVLVGLGVGCGRAPESAKPPRHRFAIIPKALDIPVFNYARTGAERAARQLGNVEVLWRGSETGDQIRQKEVLESFITQGVDGIGISCLNGDFLTETINKAVDAGIPVITWDADAPNSKRLAYYGVDDFAAGQILGEEAAKLMGGRGKVACITSLGAYNLRRRLDGVEESLRKHPGIAIVETFDIKEDTVRCAEIIASATNRHGDLAAWIAVGGWPVFTRNALDPVDPARTKVACFDTIPPAPELMKAGKVQVLIGQKYFGWGEQAVRILEDIKNGKPPAQKIVYSGVDVVTPANVDAYMADWKKLESQ